MTMQIVEKIREQLKDLKKKPGKVILSALVMIFMLLLTRFAWDGIVKRLIICLGLSVLSGVLLLLPKFSNRIYIPLLIVYLYYVPLKIFQRMELPIHDMERIAKGVPELTVAFIICVYLFIFLFTQSSAVALGAGSGLFLILFLLEYYIWKFRGDFLLPSDLKAVGTAISVMNNYNYALSPEALYSVIYLLFFIVLGSRIRIRMNRRVHLGVSAAAVLCIGVWYYIVMDTPRPLGKEFVINYWNVGDTRNMNGACMSWFFLLKDNKADVPKGYSEKALEEIANSAVVNYEKASQVSGEKPDIIMIMSESWSDLSVLGEFETTKEIMPFVDSLEKDDHTLKGNLYVSILGGFTANTEFEALTGNSLAFLSPGIVPYQNQVDHEMPSLARVLGNYGYETMAMHPSEKSAWSRDSAYADFGFDSFIDVNNWGEVPKEYIREFISDRCNFDEIIYRYENRNKEAPFYLFDVTIQNHGAYYLKGVYEGVDVVTIGGNPTDQMGDLLDLAEYVNLIKITDDAFQEFITYFEQVDRPVIICFFGDHQPRFKANFYENILGKEEPLPQEKNLRKYIVPYVVWANYEADWEEYSDMSANYIPAVILECAGLELPPFYQFLMETYREYPVLTQSGCLDKEGNLVNIEDIRDTEILRAYRMLQYNQLYVEDYQSSIFEGAITGE